MAPIVKTRFESLEKGGWNQAKKAQNNEFVESELKNWALMNQTATKMDLDDKRMKIDKFKLKKIVIGIVRGDQFLYISLKFDYKYNSRLLQCFSLSFLISFSYCLLLLLYSFPLFIFTFHVQARWLVLILVPSAPS